MSKQLAAKEKPTESKKPQPAEQDALDMLLNWIDMARGLGMDVEALYNSDRQRFTVRLAGVVANGGDLVVANGGSES